MNAPGHKLSEELLKESEERFRSVVQGLGEGLMITDLEDVLLFANVRMAELSGYTLDEMLGRQAYKLFLAPEAWKEARRRNRRRSSGEAEKYEIELKRKDGSSFWTEITATPYRTPDGQVVGTIGAVADVTERKSSEEALRQSEERFRGAFDSAPVGVALVGIDRRYLRVNAALCDMLGYAEEELLAKTSIEITHPDDLERSRVRTGRLLAGEPDAGTLEKRYFRSDGRVVWVLSSVSLVRDSEGNPSHFVSLFQDVTARREAEEALKEREHRYRRQARELSLLHRVRTALAHEIGLGSVFRTVVEAVAETYGYTLVSAYLLEGEDLVLQHQVGYAQVIDRVRVPEGVMGRVARSGRAELLADVREDPAFLGAIEGIVSEVCVPLLDDGAVVGTLNVESTYGVKLTEDDLRLMGALGDHVGLAVGRARLHARARESEARFRSLIQNASDIVMVVDGEGAVRYISPAVERVLGYKPEEVIGNDAFEVVHPEDEARVRRSVAGAAYGSVPTMDLRLRHADGTWRHVESISTNLISDPAVRGVVINSRDITERKRWENALREAENRYRTLVENIPAIAYIQEPSETSTTVYISPQVEKILGYAPEECTSDPDHWVKTLHPEDKARVLAEDARTNETGEPFREEYRQIAKDGSAVWLRDEAVMVRDEEGRSLYWQGVQIDITKRKESEAALRESEGRFRSLIRNASDVITVLDKDGVILYESPAIERVLGYRTEDLLGKSVFDFVHPGDRKRVRKEALTMLEGVKPSRPLQYRFRHKDGSWRFLESVASNLLEDPGVRGAVVNTRDITDRKNLEERLEYLAFHDPLTGLANRSLMVDRLRQALARLDRRGGTVAVAFLDLDNFKVINDSLGHDAGDRLLTAVAGKLKECVRPEDTVARLGGDEFVLLLEGTEDLGAAHRAARRLNERLAEPFYLGGREFFVNGSIGLAVTRETSEDPEELLRRADLALYKAKQNGKARYEVFDSGMSVDAVRRLETEQGLRRALERGEFVPRYQPKVVPETGEVAAMEILLRWEHPESGLLDPDDFLAVAEQTGLIGPIDDWVLGEACRQGSEWQRARAGQPSVKVNVNVSAKQFARDDLIERVSDVLRRSGMRAENLCLEVKEDVLMAGPEASIAKLTALRDLGVGIALDDFGVAYSSLAQLRRLPLDSLQLNRSFVAGLGKEFPDDAVVAAMIDLSHALGWKVVGQGVERPRQAARLAELGCDLLQGRHLSMPVTAQEATEMVVAHASLVS